ncbi:MAG TPA: class I SAM-dependent methyltransferase [Sedimentisphaerales bacterium]|nr:class I SAM-dependent methyltransferase [Sedimentisphaerales bacterium]HRS13184.1 class I SAM-dependent methyltransferase [Sedimentisphaerales bacterium]HRV49939.1 class I SAM-dependent methyltransferase [Sedimentisphaerales bacterium]
MRDSERVQATDTALSQRYGGDRAAQYFTKHRTGFFHRLTTWRELAIARRALAMAGDPDVVLDLPCGAGRFWPLLAEKPGRRILAADANQDMLRVARQMQPQELVERVECFQCSAFETGLDDGSVDCILCMRLLHHIPEPAQRLAMLREFHRVTRDTVCISLWVDGNYMATRRKRLEARRPPGDRHSRYVTNRRTIETEFRQAGFQILGHFDFLRFYSMWRVYALRKGQEMKGVT